MEEKWDSLIATLLGVAICIMYIYISCFYLGTLPLGITHFVFTGNLRKEQYLVKKQLSSLDCFWHPTEQHTTIKLSLKMYRTNIHISHARPVEFHTVLSFRD